MSGNKFYIRYRLLISAVTFAAMLIIMIAAVDTVSAAVSELDKRDGIIPEKTKLNLTKSKGKIRASGFVKKKSRSGLDMYCVKISDRSSPHIFEDLMTITYENAGVIGGKPIDVILSVDKLTVASSSDGSRPDSSSGYISFMWLSSLGTNFGRPYEGVYGYRAEKKVTASVKIVKHGTSKEINLPCFMAIRDIDLPVSKKVTYYHEAWKGISGFSGKYYVYKDNKLKIIDRSSRYPLFKSDNYEDTRGNDSTYKTGLYALTSGSSFRFMFYEGNCGTNLGIYNQYKTDKPPLLSSPVKRVGADLMSNSVNEGAMVKYTIKQRVGTYYRDVLSPYERLVFTDMIPEGLSYESVSVYNGNGRDITSQGTVNYDEASRKLTFSMGKAWLNNMKNYNGQILKFVVKTKVEPISEAVKTIKNRACVSFADGVDITSNYVTTNIYKKYSVKYIYKSGTDGKVIPGEINTETGAFAVGDTERYVKGDTVKRKSEPDNGSKYSTEEGTWTLKWERDYQTIKNCDVIFKGIWIFTENNKYSVNYIYISGTEGRPLPNDISTDTGSYKINDTESYISGAEVKRKNFPEEGIVHNEVNSRGIYTGSWKLFWDGDTKQVIDRDVTFTGTWIYTAAPKLKIIKKIPTDYNDFNGSHGEPTFIFEIASDTGTWYRAICFTEEAAEALKKYGEYQSAADSAGYSKEDGYICGFCSIVLPEGNYRITEIKTGRYETDLSVKDVSVGTDMSYDGSCNETLCEFVNEKNVFSDFSHSDYIRNTLLGGDEIQQGASYTTAGGRILTDGDFFPTETKTGDVYICGDYEYHYKQSFNGSTWVTDETMEGWGTRVTDDSKASYSKIADSINGEAVVCLRNTFSGCNNLITSPEISENITDMSCAFAGCTSLKGKVYVNACPINTEGCFTGTYESILLTGSHDEEACKSLCSTAEKGNVGCGILEENTSYYDSSGNILLEAGDEFPDSAGKGDIYKDADYEYRYDMNYGEASWVENDIGGWCVRVIDDSREFYGRIQRQICFAKVKGMIRTFSGCDNLTEAPEIPRYVTNMSYAFFNCVSLTGEIRYEQ